MLDRNQAVLVVIDIQGKLSTLMYEKERLFANVKRMIHAAKLLHIPILWTEQLPDKLGETAPEIKEALTDSNVIVKKHFSCWPNEEFRKELENLGRKQVLVTGIETHICVYQTVMDLLKSKFDVNLVIDAVSSRLEHNYHLAVQKMKDAGATLTSVEMSLFEMFEVAEGEEFREIIKIVK